MPVPRPNDAPLMSWNTPGDVEEMRKLSEGLRHTVRALFGLVESCAKWTIGELPPPRTWRSEKGKVVPVGDAAYAATPHAARGGAQAIEDAAVPGECLSQIETLKDLSAAVAAYGAIRKPRCERVRRIAKGNADILVLPDGPEQEHRDKVFKEMLEKLVEEKYLDYIFTTSASTKQIASSFTPSPLIHVL
jgi:salicylate hydroxylase